MQKNEAIIRELEEVSKYVSGLNLRDPFLVPDGYFDGLPSKMIELVRRLPVSNETFVQQGPPLTPPFEVPADFFEDFATRMMARLRAESATDEIKSLSPLLARVEKKNPFTVPDGYFDEVPENITSGMNALDYLQAELDILPASLASAKGKNVFEVPGDYFLNLPADIIKKVRPQGNVVKMNFGRRMLQYAAAAAIIGILVVTAWIYNRSDNSSSTATIAAINLDSSLDKLSDAEISNYVENNLATLPDPMTTAGNDLDPKDMKDMLADISDKELEQYLEKYGIIGDNHTN